MRKRIAKFMLVLSVASAFGALPAVSSAKHGADDPPTHHQNDDNGHHHHRHHHR
jgi:Spy/CpxP family protein refolding chaperone